MTNYPEKSGPGWLVITLWIVLLVCAPAAWYANGVSYSAGSLNIDPFSAMTRAGMCSLLVAGIWFFTAVLGASAMIASWKRTRRRVKIATAILIVIAPAIFVVGFLSASGLQKYANGFALWADRNVDAPTIRGWLATRKAVAAATSVPPADWPPVIARLKPDEVDQLPAGLGLTWGQTAEFSSRRQVFITIEGKPAPLEIKWADEWQNYGWGRWRAGKPGIWTSVQ